VNNDHDDALLKAANGQRMSVSSYGLNQYADFNFVYLAPALNRTPDHARMLGYLGIDHNYLRRATNHETYDNC